jgi:hypothetical protein
VCSAERLDLGHAVLSFGQFEFVAYVLNESLVVTDGYWILGECALVVVDEDGDVE